MHCPLTASIPTYHLPPVQEEEWEEAFESEEEEDEYAAWAAQQDAAYSQFEAMLGSTPAPTSTIGSSKKAKARPAAKQPKPGSGGSGHGMAAVGQLKGAVPERPAAPAQPPAPSGRVQLQLGRLPARPAPVKLASKPQFSAAAQAAAQRPLPPPPAPPAPPPKLASKPSRPAPPPPAAAPAPSKPQPVPALVAKPVAAAAEQAPPPAAAPVAPAAAAAPAAPPVAPKPKAPTAAEPAGQPPVAAASDAPATAATPAAAAAPIAPVVAPEAAPEKAPTAAAPATSKPQRPAARKPQPAPKEPLTAAAKAAAAAEQRARNAARGHRSLLERRIESLTVWSTNAAGVLVRNEHLTGTSRRQGRPYCLRCSEHCTPALVTLPTPTSPPQTLDHAPPSHWAGFIPCSLLSPLHLSAVHEAEQPLLAAAAAGAILAQLESRNAEASSTDGADVEAGPMRSAARKQALAQVMLGRSVQAQVVDVDDASGRVVLSGECFCVVFFSACAIRARCTAHCPTAPITCGRPQSPGVGIPSATLWTLLQSARR